MVKGETYVPIDKATMGDLLSVNNRYMVAAFGRNHIQNLSYFLQQVGPRKVGQNIRNSLAHWSNMRVNNMSIPYTAKVLWLFTDVLNSVFWYFIENAPKGEKENDQF